MIGRGLGLFWHRSGIGKIEPYEGTIEACEDEGGDLAVNSNVARLCRRFESSHISDVAVAVVAVCVFAIITRHENLLQVTIPNFCTHPSLAFVCPTISDAYDNDDKRAIALLLPT